MASLGLNELIIIMHKLILIWLLSDLLATYSDLLSYNIWVTTAQKYISITLLHV